MEVVPESMQFGRALPCILHAIWEEDPTEVPVRVSKLNVTDAYHCGTLGPPQTGAFAYGIPLALENYGFIICTDLVLPMGWVNSPKFFCAFSGMMTDMTNDLDSTEITVLAHGAIGKFSATAPPSLQRVREPHPF